MAELVLGPILRYVDGTQATVWVEVDAPCTVEVLGRSARSFRVAGRDYAVVAIEGLEPGSRQGYEVRLDGVRRWPEGGEPHPTLRTPGAAPLRVAFGSCRVALPNEPPYDLPRTEDPHGRGPDALRALAERPADELPDLLLMLGDQIYADELSPAAKAFTHTREGRAIDYEEYRFLYREAWGEPEMRRLLASLPTAMIFDDHDVHDDWNTSQRWLRQMRALDWWDEHIVSALAAYWVYQHLGNLSPAELAQDPLYAEVRSTADGADILRDHARRADREPGTLRFSHRRDLGGTRLVVLDSRAARVLEPERRSMLADSEWAWLDEALTGDVDHLLLASSLPVLLAPTLHDLEAWSEAVCAGAWGRRGSRLGERLRERFDLEHWAAFGDSFERLTGLLGDVAAGRRGAAPASIVVLSGDVHHHYVAESDAFHQVVCSPMRNELERQHRLMVRAACTPLGRLAGRLLAIGARRGRRATRWRLRPRRPWFHNDVAQLTLDGRAATLRFQSGCYEAPLRSSAERNATRLRGSPSS